MGGNMASESPVYEVAFDENEGEWHIVERKILGDVRHQASLAERYETKELAEEAAGALRK